MSWSVGAIGKPSKVAEKLTADFARINCAEPEQTIKNNVAAAILAGLAAYPDTHAVKVNASGNQMSGGEGQTGKFINGLSVSMETIYGFVE